MNMLLNDASDASLKQAAIIASPYVPWGSQDFWGLVRAWVAAASTFPQGERNRSERYQRAITDHIFWIATAGKPRRRLVMVETTAFPTIYLPGTPPGKSLGCNTAGPRTQGYRDPQVLLAHHLVGVGFHPGFWFPHDVRIYT